VTSPRELPPPAVSPAVYDEDYYSSATNKQLNYGAVNLLYWFLGDRGWMGVEYLYGHRQVFGGGDDNATAHRIQYAIRFNLP
jgi:hypothetical protein